jgi:hypothetical protein
MINYVVVTICCIKPSPIYDVIVLLGTSHVLSYS